MAIDIVGRLPTTERMTLHFCCVFPCNTWQFYEDRPFHPEFSGYCTLWQTNIWKDPPSLVGKLTISTGPVSIAMLNYQRVYQILPRVGVTQQPPDVQMARSDL